MCRAEPAAAQGRSGGGFSLEDSKDFFYGRSLQDKVFHA